MDVEQQRAQSRAMWADGHYPAVAERLASAAERVVAAANVRPGDRVLDVGTGSGNVALRAARRGARVIGVDQIETWFDDARAAIAAEGLDADLVVGDARDLPAGDGEFDIVLSCFAHIFVPDHDAVTRELLRVCRSSGTVGVTAWAYDPDDNDDIGTFDIVREYLGDDGDDDGPTNADWGDPSYLRSRFADHGVHDMVIERHVMRWQFPTLRAHEDFLFTASGPYRWMRSRLTDAGVWDQAWERIRQIEARDNLATDGSYISERDYLVAVGRVP